MPRSIAVPEPLLNRRIYFICPADIQTPVRFAALQRLIVIRLIGREFPIVVARRQIRAVLQQPAEALRVAAGGGLRRRAAGGCEVQRRPPAVVPRPRRGTGLQRRGHLGRVRGLPKVAVQQDVCPAARQRAQGKVSLRRGS